MPGVPVADFKQRSRGVHRNKQRGPGDKFLVVEIARMNPRRRAIDLPSGGRRREPHASEERLQREIDARSEVPNLTLPVKRNDLRNRRRK